jgi:hypothetical protein
MLSKTTLLNCKSNDALVLDFVKLASLITDLVNITVPAELPPIFISLPFIRKVKVPPIILLPIFRLILLILVTKAPVASITTSLSAYQLQGVVIATTKAPL